MPTTSPINSQERISGHFDLVSNSHACGWAINHADLGQRVGIEIVCGERIVGRGEASYFRKDLVNAGGGDGKHMFRIPLSYELYDNARHVLFARSDKSGILLPGSERVFGPFPSNHPFDFAKREVGLAALMEELKKPRYGHLLSKSSNFARAYDYACVLQETGLLAEALEAWSAIQHAMQTSYVCQWKIAENYMLQGRILRARQHYEECIRHDQNPLPALEGMKLINLLTGANAALTN